MPDALQMLKDDHRKVQEMFKQFEQLESPQEKKRLVTQAIMELEVHTQLEEEIFYPAVEREVQPEDGMMDEAEEEHHVAKMLIKELKGMGPKEENYDAKFKVLAENVKHHIQEEETLMLPRAAELGSGRLQELGNEMAERKVDVLALVKRAGRSSARSRGTTRSRSGSSTGARTGSRNGSSSRRTTTRATGTRTSTRTGRSGSGSTSGRSAAGLAGTTRSRSSGTTRGRPGAVSGSKTTRTAANTRSRSTVGTSSRARSTSARSRSTTSRSPGTTSPTRSTGARGGTTRTTRARP